MSKVFQPLRDNQIKRSAGLLAIGGVGTGVALAQSTQQPNIPDKVTVNSEIYNKVQDARWSVNPDGSATVTDVAGNVRNVAAGEFVVRNAAIYLNESIFNILNGVISEVVAASSIAAVAAGAGFLVFGGGSDSTQPSTPVSTLRLMDDSLAITAGTGAATSTLSVLSNDSATNGGALTLTNVSTTSATFGSFQLNAAGTDVEYLFADNAMALALGQGQSATDTATYTVTHANGTTATATITVTITGVNDAPVVAGETTTLAEDAANSAITITTGEGDVDGDTLIYVITTLPTNGTLSANGVAMTASNLPASLTAAQLAALTYTPNANYNGADSFDYTVSDGTVTSAAQTHSLTITPVNDAPIVSGETTTLAEDSGATGVTITTGESDVEGDTLTYVITTLPLNGTLLINGVALIASALPATLSAAQLAALTYTPNANYNGTDSFDYSVSDAAAPPATATHSLTITPVNDAPVVAGETTTLAEDAANSAITITTGEGDVDGDTLVYVITTLPTNGTLSANGVAMTASNLPATLTAAQLAALTYTPNANYNGADSFDYTVSDGTVTSAAQTHSMTITPVNDAPIVAGETTTLAEDSGATGVTITTGESDVEGDTLTYVITTLPLNGTLLINGVALIASALPATLTPAQLAALTYTPNANYNGTDSFDYSVSDAAAPPATVTHSLTITPVNDAPVVAGETTALHENDTAVAITLTTGESDIDGDTLTYIISTLPANGTLTANGVALTASNLPATLTAAQLAALTFTPNANYNGTDSFTYTVSDGTVTSAAQTHSLTINAVPEFLSGTTVEVIEGKTATGYTAIATDADLSGTVTYSLTGGTDQTKFSINPATGALSFIAAPDFENFDDSNTDGIYEVIITANDGAGGLTTQTVLVTLADDPTETGNIKLGDIDDSSNANGFAIKGFDSSDRSGHSVSNAGDVNGDGLDDLIVGSPFAILSTGSSAGESFVVFGKADGTAVELSDIQAGTGGFIINGASAYDTSGRSVSGAGDVNGDGLDDLIIGVSNADPTGGQNAGESYVVFGKANTTALNLSDVQNGTGGFAINGVDQNDFSGRSVSGAGDVNGDGLDDLIIGAFRADQTGGFDHGESYVVFGKANSTAVDLSAVQTGTGGFVINGVDAGDRSGRSVSNAGDVNGDGLDDLIVSGYRADTTGGLDTGESYIVFGKTNGTAVNLSAIQAGTGGFVINGVGPYDESGFSVSSAGDVNGDGLDDLIVGAGKADPSGNTQAGESYVVYGKTNTTAVNLSAVQAGTGGFVINGVDAGDNSGFSVSSAGDVNGDGLDDLIIGANLADTSGGIAVGESYVVYGKTNSSAVNLSAIQSGTGGFVISGISGGDNSGYSVSSAGDVNGDGFDDLIVGAPRTNQLFKSDAGESYVIFGGDFTSSVTFVGTAAADILMGTAANEAIYGGQGTDTITSMGGSDRLSGGQGADSFVISDGPGTVTIIDFENANTNATASEHDKIDVSAFGFANFAALQAVMSFSAPGNDDTTIQLDADTILIIENTFTKTSDGVGAFFSASDFVF